MAHHNDQHFAGHLCVAAGVSKPSFFCHTGDMSMASDIPIAHTPPGGYGQDLPAPILASCAEPLSGEAVDLRGTWEVVLVESNGEIVAGHPLLGNIQRIEQCGNRVVICSSGVVHDMGADGTLENGVHDVQAADFTTEIHVTASFEEGVHVLRPEGMPIEVRRWLDGSEMVWEYGPMFTARLKKL